MLSSTLLRALCALCALCVNLFPLAGRSPLLLFRRKRQYVRRPFLFAKGLIHPRDLDVANEANRDFRISKIHFVFHTAKKRFERLPRNADRTLAVQNHARWFSLLGSLLAASAAVPA